MKTFIPYAAALLLALSSSLPAIADIAPDPMSGGKPPRPRLDEKTTVVMKSETVNLVLHKDKCEVSASFNMSNPGPDSAMEIGFPLNYSDELRDFKALVEGKDAHPRLHSALKNVGPPRMQKQIREYWYVWDLKLAKDSSCRVDVSYWTPLRKNLCLGRNGQLSWPDRTVDERFCRFSAGYVLATGAGWAGSIGRAEITASFQGLVAGDALRGFSPPGAEIKDGKLSWTFENLEPKDTRNRSSFLWEPDIEVTFCPGGTLDEEIRAFEAVAQSYKKDDLLVLIHLADLEGLKEKTDSAAQARCLSAFFDRPRNESLMVFHDNAEAAGLLDACLRILKPADGRKIGAEWTDRCRELARAVKDGSVRVRSYNHMKKKYFLHPPYGKDDAPKADKVLSLCDGTDGKDGK